MVQPLRAKVEAEIKDVFARQENLAEIRWTQYTPYFNDGDVCEFGVRELVFRFVGKEYGDRWDWEWLSKEKRENPENAPLVEFVSLIHRIPDEVMEGMFGDGYEIKFNRGDDHLTVEEYEHD